MSQSVEEIKKVIAEEIKCEVSDLDLETAVGDLPNWDSLGHARVLLAVEKRFDTKFTLDEHLELESVQDIYEVLLEKGSIAA